MERLVSYSPATLEEVGSVEITPVEEIPAIIERSRKAQKIWEGYSQKEKADLFKKLTVLVADKSEEIGHLVHLETGKPKAEAINMESYVATSFANYCELWLRKFKFDRKVSLAPVNGMMKFLGRSSRIIYRPMGVVASITTNNFPVCIPFTESATAVAAGNSVIIKPSPDTPLGGELVASLFKEAGFPEDLVICINGPMVGEALTESNDIDRLLFTGGTNTGKSVLASAARGLTPTSLELGGCDAVIVFDDADFERAVTCGVWGAFTNAGQVCVGFQRILVQRNIYDKYVEQFVKETKALKIGSDWNDPDMCIGPLVSERALNIFESNIDKALKAGGHIACGGKRLDRIGYFYEPTVVTDLPTDSEIFNSEIFGPYVSISPFDTEEEAIDIVNGSEFALGGSVWSSDLKRAYNVSKKLRPGSININNGLYNYGMPSVPWGGQGASGFGRTHGEDGFMSLMQPQHIHTDRGRFEIDPWWMPFNKETTYFQTIMTKGLYGTGKRPLSTLVKALPLLKKKK